MPVFEVFEDEDGLEEIHARLKDDDAMVRRIAVLDLAESAEPTVIDTLIDCLKDNAAEVRLEAALSLIHI